jgi:ubiquinone/menaquinone biosynthesis C-methylase UbiE
LEPACGSANDYRYLHRFGVSRFLIYTGFDICEKNVANARRRFPDISFEVADVLEIPYENNSYDYLFVHDLFEHLSPEAFEAALAEISRVTRKQACLSFFNMADIEQSVIKQSGLYYWNTLSLSRTEELLMDSGRDIDVIGIDKFLKANYNCDDYHNKEAYTIVVTFDQG